VQERFRRDQESDEEDERRKPPKHLLHRILQRKPRPPIRIPRARATVAGLIEFLTLPLLACLILAGIHTYLGVHIVERGAIFAGLAMAQIAALGTTVAVLAGGLPYVWSLAFTIVGAAIFAITRVHREAIFGIVYAVAAAAAILIMSTTPEGAQQLRDILAGHILTVSKHALAETAGLYALVGLFHYIFRKKFLAISTRWWDFVFYTSLGVVVTSSVAIAGVLPVFSYRTVPSDASMLFAKSTARRLAIGWSMGAIVSAIGITISFQADLPTSATIVCTFGVALLLAGVWRFTRRGKASAER